MAIIIAILLGIIVIGLIGFWLFKSTGTFGTRGVESGCRERFLLWCQDFAKNGYDKDWLASNFFNSKNKNVNLMGCLEQRK